MPRRRYRSWFGPPRRRRNWYTPEDLGPEQDARDAQDPSRRFFVYVLRTDYGHYVGHSARPRARLREHIEDPNSPVWGGNPELIWISRPFMTRRDAAGFEAAMKSLRQRRARRFAEIVGAEPQPFHRFERRRRPVAARQPAARRDGCGPPAVAVVSVISASARFVASLGVSFIRGRIKRTRPHAIPPDGS